MVSLSLLLVLSKECVSFLCFFLFFLDALLFAIERELLTSDLLIDMLTEYSQVELTVFLTQVAKDTRRKPLVHLVFHVLREQLLGIGHMPEGASKGVDLGGRMKCQVVLESSFLVACRFLTSYDLSLVVIETLLELGKNNKLSNKHFVGSVDGPRLFC